MSAFKYFAPPEWDADVPEIAEGINLTKKNKLRKKVKYSATEKSENGIEDLNKINNLPLKRKNDPFEVITPKKKKRKNESGTYVKFDSPKINNTLTDSFQLDNIVKSVNKNDNKNHSKRNELDVDVNINQSNDSISKKKKKKDKQQKKSDKHEIVLEKKQKKSKNDDVNNTAIEFPEEVPVENNNKAKKNKKNKIQPMEIETNASDDVNVEENQISSNGISKNKKDKKNKIKSKEIVTDKTVADTIDTEEHVSPVNGIGKSKKEKKNPSVVSNKSLNESSNSSNKKLSKKSKNKLKKAKKKQEEVLKNPIIPPVEPVCTIAAQIVDNKPVNNSKKSNLHVKKLKQLLDNMKPNTEPIADDIEVRNENTAILSSLNDTMTTQNNIISLHKSLRERMMERLKSARFRYINEQLYVKPSNDAHQVFKDDPGAFMAYHNGYRQQVSKWPINPLDVIIKEILKLPKDQVIADLGCGDARLSKSVPHTVFSFDLVALDPSINACDMSRTPLHTSQVSVVVFCLSLMSTNLKNYLIEANRILKPGGLMKIAEVESRFNDVEQFIADVKKYGFSMVKKDLDHNLFYFMDFKKENDIKKRNKLPDITLNACLYKKR